MLPHTEVKFYPEVNSSRFHFGMKFDFGVRQLYYQRLHHFRRSETHFGVNFTLVKLIKMKFQTAVTFPCKQ